MPEIPTIPEKFESFKQFVFMAFDNKELVQNFDRLRGTNLMRRGTSLDLKIDDASERLDRDLELFIEFCADLWVRL